MNDITLTIRRASGLQSYPVPYQPGMSILDGLRYLSAHHPNDPAYRWECGQGVCGVCTMMINGRAALSCTTLADPGGVYTCEPLTNFPVKRDLVVDLTPKIDQMRPFHPYLIEGGHPVQSREEAEAGKKLRTCVECWACVAVCPISLTAPAHALTMVKLARFELDPRDGADRREEAQRGGLDAYTAQCASCRACESVCPKGIDVFIDAIQVLT